MRVLLATLLLAVCGSCFATSDVSRITIARERQATDEKIAMLYVGAIVIAGACVGLGIYFGLRHQKK